MTRWTDERKARLVKLWNADDLSSAEIAVDLGGVTRAAVIGQAHRMDLPPKGTSMTQGVRIRRGYSPVPIASGKRRSKARALRREIDIMDTVQSLRLSFAEIRSGDYKCRFICNDDVRAPEYCGLDVFHDTSWCPGHFRLVTETPSQAAQRKAEWAIAQRKPGRVGGFNQEPIAPVKRQEFA